MSSLANLERLLTSDAALEQARLAQSGAMNTQQMLKQPLSNFNQGSLRNPAGIASLERLQGSIRVQQYLDTGVPRHSPAYVPKASPTGASTAIGGGGAVATAGAPASPTATSAVNAPARISIPVTGAGALNVVAAYQTVQQLGTAIGNVATGIGNVSSLLSGQPENVRSLQPYFADPTENLRRQLTEPNPWLSGLMNALGLPPPPGANPFATAGSDGLSVELQCQIYGTNCPTTQPGGVPNLGSPGAAPPFYGGQGVGRAYQVMVQYEVKVNGSTIDTDTRPINANGPIRGVRAVLDNEAPGTSYQIQVVVDPATNGGVDHINVSAGSGGGPYEASQAIVSITPLNGQPDTGGNPSPSPGAPNRPATTPPLVNRPVTPPPGAPALPSTGVPNPATTPITAPPAAPPETATPDPFAPFRNPDPLALLPMLGLVPFLAPSGGSFFNPSGAPQAGGDLTKTPTKTGDVPTPTCRYDSSNIAGRVDQTNTTLNLVQLFMEQQMMSKLNTIDAKLGPQIPGGGIGNFIKKTWNFLQVDRVLSVLTWIGVLHNAYMLSNALTQTLFIAFSNILDVFGVEDADGGALDVGAIVSGWTDAFFKRIFGVETVNGIKEGWKKFNRIYQAAANIIFSIQSITFSMVEMLEVISNYVGRIGNALRKAGGVLENAYGWMNPNANYTNNRFFNALNRTSEAVEAIDQVASETLSIQETGEELFNQKEEFDKSVDDAQKLVDDQETAAKGASGGVTINPSDERKPE